MHFKKRRFYGGVKEDEFIKGVEGIPQKIFDSLSASYNPKRKLPTRQGLTNALRELEVDDETISTLVPKFMAAMDHNVRAKEINPGLSAAATSAEPAEIVLDPEILEKNQTAYFSFRKSLNEKEAKSKIEFKLANAKIPPNTIKKYLEALKEEEAIDFSQEKFKRFYKLWSCNRQCLREYLDTIAVGFGLTAKETKNFLFALETGEMAKIFPDITDQCGPKQKSTETSSFSTTQENKLEESDEANDATLSYDNLEKVLKAVKINILTEKEKLNELEKEKIAIEKTKKQFDIRLSNL